MEEKISIGSTNNLFIESIPNLQSKKSYSKLFSSKGKFPRHTLHEKEYLKNIVTTKPDLAKVPKKDKPLAKEMPKLSLSIKENIQTFDYWVLIILTIFAFSTSNVPFDLISIAPTFWLIYWLARRWVVKSNHEELEKKHKKSLAENSRIDPMIEMVQKYNSQRKLYWEDRVKLLKANLKDYVKQYNADKTSYEVLANRQKKIASALKILSSSGKGDDIAKWWSILIANADIPECLKLHSTCKVDTNSNVLIFSLSFPDLSKTKVLKKREVKYELKDVAANKTERKEALKHLFFSYPIRLAWEISNSSIGDKFQNIVINSIVHRPDPATGHASSVCIGSVMIECSKIKSILIDKIDPWITYKGFKGVYSGEPNEVIDTIPILTFSESERRFVEGRDIAKDVIGTNLASIDWEDFEHLIRELFEKEFAKDDAEVKVTKASRDKGVDAIVMDKDPIRGGKFIVQAKRYTNTVDVSSVRDLYGTTLNEGANRGILVTTSSYGPDSYEFAKDKPITLLNGKDLISLMSKHGYDCYIDIKQAKKMLGLE